MRNKTTDLIKKTVFYMFLLLSSTVFGQWKFVPSPSKVSFRSMSMVSQKVIWAGGSGGTIIKSSNSGKDWKLISLQSELDFRGIHAFNRRKAVAMSAGEAEKGLAKIFKTDDGGETWEVVYQTTEKGVFLDCLKFKNKKTGYVLGDPTKGKPFVLKTTDGGNTWQRIDPAVFPEIKEGEASFAASNSNISLINSRVLFNTQSRVFVSEDAGATWQVIQTPFEQGQTSGIFGLYFENEKRGFAVGGDYINDKATYPNIATTTNGGVTWQFTTTAEPQGLKESVWKIGENAYIAVGTSGTSFSADNGTTWQAIDEESFHVVQCAGKTCFAIGGKGRLGKWM